ncbi:ribonuclease H-like superfamily protein [Striga asiatica]|uniref:Ribonuclease H-like superfamily protein n=1 Tax=Striga asiatica TaxID=4170 RepID=A0A5A7PTD4_STRAF|nr:ribonuclease H-like superfamily protein [Striga asiatica]
MVEVDNSPVSEARIQLSTYILWWLWKSRNLWVFQKLWMPAAVIMRQADGVPLLCSKVVRTGIPANHARLQSKGKIEQGLFLTRGVALLACLWCCQRSQTEVLVTAKSLRAEGSGSPEVRSGGTREGGLRQIVWFTVICSRTGTAESRGVDRLRRGENSPEL